MASARGAKKLSGWAFEQVRASKTRAYNLQVGGNRERARADPEFLGGGLEKLRVESLDSRKSLVPRSV